MFEYKGIKINYIRYGNPEGAHLVLLHGWGQNIQMMKPVGDGLQKNDIIILDFQVMVRARSQKRFGL